MMRHEGHPLSFPGLRDLIGQERVSMLLVHGLIHLLGYDHETDEDFEAMVAEEEKVLRAIGAAGPVVETAPGNGAG